MYSEISRTIVSPWRYLLCLFVITAVDATETVIYSTGFENDDGGYTNNGWEWGVPDPLFSLGPDAAHSGNKCWGTDLDDTVQYNSNLNLVSPGVIIPALTGGQVARVRFFGWISVDFMEDRGQFQVSSDGVTWETKTELLLSMNGGWNEYVFDVSDYAGGTIYLRFRCFVDGVNTFDPPIIPENMAGFYVDDVAIVVAEAPSVRHIMTFEGNEYQSSVASCPWVLAYDGNRYRKDNDIYSTARGNNKEYTDYYKLNMKPVVDDKGKYRIKLKETEQEESFTDLLELIIVDHNDTNVEIACDENGNVFTFKNFTNPDKPSTAVDKNGRNVRGRIKNADEIGYKAYNGDYIDLDFSMSDDVDHPILLLKSRGFQVDTVPGTVMPSQPKIEILTQDEIGQWVTRNVFYPRWKFALSGYDMAGLFPYAKKVRLRSVSCHTGKYHLIDWAALSTKPQRNITVTTLTPLSAKRSDGVDVTGAISAQDGDYVHMSTGEQVKLRFSAPDLASGKKRDFIIRSRGYYIPNGTFFFFTWDGEKWTQRDGWTIPDAGDQTREFDLSLWLPDPEGRSRVRIWQDYFFDPAGVDYVGLRRDGVDLTMTSGIDLRDNSDILNLLSVSDNQQHLWDWGEDWPYRDRWIEVEWTDNLVNTPPATNPVYVTNPETPTPVVNWTYFDLDGDMQVAYEVEVWTGPDGTGSNFWDPATGSGTVTSVIYEGASLVEGELYYARVKAFDGTDWGGWSEAVFTASTNSPPVAEAGPDQIVAGDLSCMTSVVLDGTASFDPDDDPISYLWTGAFGTETGPKPAVYLPAGTFLVRLIVTDSNGATGMDSVTITVNDLEPPVPDSATLPVLSGECRVIITDPPTATDSCAGTVVGVTDVLTFKSPGTYEITWSYDDGNGNISMQPQTVIVTDNTAPVPDVSALPEIINECEVMVTSQPTATDNCMGPIQGTTEDKLVYDEQGIYTITWLYVDAAGNSTTQTQAVTVTDETAPVPDVAELPVITGECEVEVEEVPTATDNCTGTISATTGDPLEYSTAGTYTVAWEYNDGNGNVATQIQTVIVTDSTPPVPDEDTLPEIRRDCKVKIRNAPTATDDCSGEIVGTTTDPLKYNVHGTYTVTWRYDDGNGNVSTQEQTIVVIDTTPPVPKKDTLPTITGNCFAYVRKRPMATDDCNCKIVGKTENRRFYKKQGIYTIIWTYTDRSGNVTTQPQTVIVNDTTAPVPTLAELPVLEGVCKVCVCDKPTAVDNCKNQLIGKTSDPLCYKQQGTYTIHWKFKDGNGNKTIQEQTIIVHDDVAPVPDVSPLPDIYGQLTSYNCKIKCGYCCLCCCPKKYEVKTFPTATDNCTGAVLATTSSPLVFYKKGDFIIVWEYDDGNGNIATQNQIVHVR